MQQWSKREENILRRAYPKLGGRTTAALLNRSLLSVKSRVDRLGLRRKNWRHNWSAEERETIARLYPDTPTDEIAKKFFCKVDSIYRIIAQMGVKKSAAYNARKKAAEAARLIRSGAKHRFKPGQVAHNKGLRRPGYSKLHGRMAETTFKKGQLNGHAKQHFMPIGSTRLIDGYLYRKVTEIQNVPYTVNWKLEHVLMWEKAYKRSVPRGHALVFKDGDRTNVVLANLELITRAELMRRNTIHNMNPELKSTIMLAGYLKRRIGTIERKQRGKK